MDGPIDVNLEPEGEEPDDVIIIHTEDLRSRPEPDTRAYIPPVAFSPMRRSLIAIFVRGLVGRNLLAGVFSAFFAAIILQVFIPAGAVAGAADGFGFSMLVTALYIAAAAGMIGAALAAAEPASQGNKSVAASRALTGLLLGAIGGLVGGVAAQIAASVTEGYAVRMGDEQSVMFLQFAGSFAGWGLAGLAIGIGRNFGPGSGTAKNGLISGVIGGMIGGLVMGLAATSFDSAAVARLMGLLGFGLAMGGAAAGTDETIRDNWLMILDGPRQGAQFTLLPGRVLIGSSPRCGIFLSGPMIAPIHCELEIDYAEALLTNLTFESSVLVNGRPCRSCAIVPGDVLQVGTHLMRWCEKED